MILTDPKQWKRESKFGVQHTTDQKVEKTVKWFSDSEKRLSQGYKVRKKVAKDEPQRVALPDCLIQLLTCKRERIPTYGMRALRWLQDRPTISRKRELERLASRVNEAQRANRNDGMEPNRIAAIEVLASFQSPMTLALLENWLTLRPVTEGHLYLVAMPRSIELARTTRTDSLAGRIIDVFESVVGQGEQNTNEWTRRLGVEVFRTLAALAPTKALGPICRHLPTIGSLELSAVLEAVLEALRTPGTVCTPELTDAAEQLWVRYLRLESGQADNIPGVIARLLEVFVRSGEPLDEKLLALHSHRLQASSLYLFTQHGLGYTNRQDQKRYYLEALNALKSSKQTSSFRKLFLAVPRELGIAEKDLQ